MLITIGKDEKYTVYPYVVKQNLSFKDLFIMHNYPK